ncbi:MAG: imidazole glycerol phosphate synthase subunit HisF [Planctomycetota bacterium]
MSEPVKIMPCLDVREGRVVKGIHFVDLTDAGDPAECASAYCAEGADELAFLDITATVEGRETLFRCFREVVDVADVPLTLGGGLSSLKDIEKALDAGADKVSMGSAAVREPELVEEAAKEFGPGRVVVAIDADGSKETRSGYEVYIEGGRTPTRIDALEFARAMEDRGAGTILPTSKRRDGTRDGYDIELTRGISRQVDVPVIASGGAGKMEHFYQAATEGGASILLAASVFHFGDISIPELKSYLHERELEVRPMDEESAR